MLLAMYSDESSEAGAAIPIKFFKASRSVKTRMGVTCFKKQKSCVQSQNTQDMLLLYSWNTYLFKWSGSENMVYSE